MQKDDSVNVDKLDLNLDECLEEHCTPTFNSNNDDNLLKQFPFLEDKENEDANRKVILREASPCSRHSADERKQAQEEKASPVEVSPKVDGVNNVDPKSRGSTSPESNGQTKQNGYSSSQKRSKICQDARNADTHQTSPEFRIKRRDEKCARKSEEDNQTSGAKASDKQEKG
eukprot:CAMPEP_0168320074 /NCGR_PEP_ID=MMETSP0213-20121227/1439_1 /TAXON_ID=151035 /ORGANISM="Euplotes harpa, Strain FSP1.4" /LENGTH=171 /DNA_ID=CAMNT_0008321425 /DNA_START=485 /DNA_END=1000 /DNA_ORIENTATION=-